MPIPDSDALIESGFSTEKPFLGSPSVIEGLLRRVLYDITVARRAQLERGEDAIAVMLRKADELQRVLYGQDPAYQAYVWNSPKHLGRFLVERCGIGGDTSDAVNRAAIRMMRDFAFDLVAYEDDRITEQQMQASVDALIDKFTRIFVGIGDVE
ncbi:hypothetical protein Tther_02228 [Tepidimonas thermarum]|uniref:Uncharacterized protein n=1 Tax=Tepidimonas thermarum TaxID=335431 RepID=A0A554WXG9_9BURK|nr:hypothetical protein [Tepidimonas thermarum]TSE28272.1 hypothetical protein Tther_02228 [Tepidimonas thermarum]